MERDRYRHSKSHRGPRDRRGEVILAALVVGVFVLAAAITAVVAWTGDDGSDVSATVAGAASDCTPST